jgi:hypothetical protein
LLALLALSACARSREVVARPEAAVAANAWRTPIAEADRARLRNWRKTWSDALAAARPGNEAAIAGEGSLLDPDAGLAGVRLPAGDYRCRWLKLGAQGATPSRYRSFDPQPCRLTEDGGRLHFRILGGPQRPLGAFFPDNSRRMIFLGTLQLGDEALAYRYGRDAERDMVGIVERIGDRRWRLVLPAPHFESLLDVIELVPAS